MYWPRHRMTEGHTEIIDGKLALIRTLIVEGNEYRSQTSKPVTEGGLYIHKFQAFYNTFLRMTSFIHWSGLEIDPRKAFTVKKPTPYTNT